MTIFKKKLLLLLFALLAAVSLGLGLMFMPAAKSSAAEVVLDRVEHFTIEGGVFKGLSNEGNTAVGTNNFSIELPDSVTSIGENALKDNTKLISIEVPDSVTSIGAGAFSGCSSLVEARIPNIATIPANLFLNCYKLEKLNAAGTKDFNIPESVTTIGASAFSSCIAIKELTVPANVSSIDSKAFYALEGAAVINYLAERATSVDTKISPFAMDPGGYAKVRVTVNFGDRKHAVGQIPQAIFVGHKSVKEVNFNNVQLPGGITDFGINAFSDCTSLAKVNFSDNCNVPVINSSAFSGCTSLYSVTGLEKIGLGTIADKAFFNCRSLLRISIGDQVKTIDADVFSGCEKLIEVENLSDLDISAKDGKHGGVAAKAEYVYGAEGKSRISEEGNFVFYKDKTNSDKLLAYTGSQTNVTLPKGSYDIYKYAFFGNTSMQELWLPGLTPSEEPTITVIGAYAFDGCSSLTDVKLPKSVSEIGMYAFANCSSLETVNFNENETLSTLAENVFQNCDSIVSITIPKSVITIKSYAFSGCSNLNIVTFTPDSKTGGVERYKLETLENNAFEKCTSMSAIKIPGSVSSVGNNCFSGCFALQYVYLPSNGENGKVTYGSGVFGNCHAGMVLISIGKSQNANDKINLKDKTVEGTTLTYIITVELKYGGFEISVPRLYGMPGDYERTANGLNWIWTKSSSMPRQGVDGIAAEEGIQQYATSVWYEDQSYEKQVNFEKFTQMLAEEVDSITLYAEYYAHPNLKVTNRLKYTGTQYTISELLTNGIIRKNDGSDIKEADAEKLTSDFHVTISSHTLTDGTPDLDSNASWKNAENPKVSDAGKYVMSFSLPSNGEKGRWEDDYTIEFLIDPIEQNINDLILWTTEEGALEPKTGDAILYFFEGQTTPYLTPQIEGYDPSGAPVYQTNTKTVLTSYTVYSDKQVTVKLDKNKLKVDGGGDFSGSVDETSYQNNIATAPGTYRAQVTLKPSNNYTFTFSTTENTNRRGLSFEVDEHGSLTVYKTWYIAISDANQLLSNDGGGMFNMPSKLTYLDEKEEIPKRPSLSKLNDRLEDPASNILTFSLEFNSVALCSRISITKYEFYVNSSMPVGDYKITFYIASAKDGDSVIPGDPEGRTFNFTVQPYGLGSTYLYGIDSKLRGFSQEYKSDELVFASTEGIEVLNKQQADRTGTEWEKEVYDSYYKGFEILYLVERTSPYSASSKGYFTLADYVKGVDGTVKPQAIGTYKINYRISAPNYVFHAPDYSNDVRNLPVWEGSYNVNITNTINFTLANVDYKAENVLGDVISALKDSVLDELNYFEIYTLLDYSKLDSSDPLKETKALPDAFRGTYHGNKYDEYSSVGTHYIYLTIKSEYSAYILCSNTKKSGYYELTFNVVAAENREKVALSIVEWEYGMFDESVNKPVWELVLGDDYTRYKFTLQLKSDSSVEYYYNGNPQANEAIAGHTFNDAPAGEYKLFAQDIGNPAKGYKEFTSASIDVKVHKVNIFFKDIPYLSGWTYGTLKKDTAVSIGYTLGDKLDQSLVAGIQIKYLKADGTLGNLADLAPNGQDYIPAGDYYLVLTRDESDNVAQLYYKVKFSVLKAQNYWDTAPSIPNWTYGAFDKSLIVTPDPHFGKGSTILVDYRTANGEWVELDNLLVNGQLAVGEYQMRVRPVFGSDDKNNFTDLDPVVITFNVYAAGTTNVPSGTVGGDNSDKTVGDDGISNGAVIGAIIAFAVIAAAVVAAFVVLTIIANKKANAEYIKTVKSEMKRR